MPQTKPQASAQGAGKRSGGLVCGCVGDGGRQARLLNMKSITEKGHVPPRGTLIATSSCAPAPFSLSVFSRAFSPRISLCPQPQAMYSKHLNKLLLRRRRANRQVGSPASEKHKRQHAARQKSIKWHCPCGAPRWQRFATVGPRGGKDLPLWGPAVAKISHRGALQWQRFATVGYVFGC